MTLAVLAKAHARAQDHHVKMHLLVTSHLRVLR
jgi:hypothetical protein